MKYVMYKLVQIKKGQHVFACHKTFKGLITPGDTTPDRRLKEGCHRGSVLHKEHP